MADTTENRVVLGETFRRRAATRKQRKLLISLLALAAFAVAQFAAAYLVYPEIANGVPNTIRNSFLVFTLAFLFVQFVTIKMANVTAYRVTGQVLPIWFLTAFSGLGIILMLRFDYGFWFSILSLISGTIILGLFSGAVTKRIRYRLGVPANLALSSDLAPLRGDAIIELSAPEMPEAELDVIVVDERHLQDHDWTQFLSWCAINSVPVMMVRDYMERETGEIDLDNFALGDALRLISSRNYLIVKRAIDIVVCGVGLVLLLPAMIVLALMIRLESPGAALFTQQRIGRGGRVFTMYKFRSMKKVAEVDGAKFARKGDPRITRIGRVIRKMRIDEWPQLYNVVIGDMSLIGPRPEQAAFLDELADSIPLFPLRHAVRPGITGWAQVCYGYADDVDSTRRKIAHDLFYIRNISFLLDVNIVIRTIKIIFSGFGAR